MLAVDKPRAPPWLRMFSAPVRTVDLGLVAAGAAAGVGATGGGGVASAVGLRLSMLEKPVLPLLLPPVPARVRLSLRMDLAPY